MDGARKSTVDPKMLKSESVERIRLTCETKSVAFGNSGSEITRGSCFRSLISESSQIISW